MTPKINPKTATPTMAVLMIVLFVVAGVMSHVLQHRPPERTLSGTAPAKTAPPQVEIDLDHTYLATD